MEQIVNDFMDGWEYTPEQWASDTQPQIPQEYQEMPDPFVMPESSSQVRKKGYIHYFYLSLIRLFSDVQRC